MLSAGPVPPIERIAGGECRYGVARGPDGRLYTGPANGRTYQYGWIDHPDRWLANERNADGTKGALVRPGGAEFSPYTQRSAFAGFTLPTLPVDLPELRTPRLRGANVVNCGDVLPYDLIENCYQELALVTATAGPGVTITSRTGARVNVRFDTAAGLPQIRYVALANAHACRTYRDTMWMYVEGTCIQNCVAQTTTSAVAACDSALVHGVWRLTSDSYAATTASVLTGCDSTSTVALTLNASARTSEARAGCDSALVFGVWRTTSDTYIQTLRTMAGCDSTHSVVLTLGAGIETMGVRQGCDSAFVHGAWRSASGPYTSPPTPSVQGCDSVHTIQLTLVASVATSETQAGCDSVLVFGVWRTASDTYAQTFPSAAGCDSTHSVVLTLGAGIATTENVGGCDSTLVFGTWRTASDTYRQSFTSATGCDSTHSVMLTLGAGIATTGRRDGCDSAFVHGAWRYVSGDYASMPAPSAQGCDSVHTVQLTLANSVQTRAVASGCDSALVFGVWRTASNTYAKTFPSAAGCDSTHSVVLTLGAGIATTENVGGCDSTLVFGTWRTASGIYASDPLASAEGCDSVHMVTLVLGASVATSETQQACDSALVFGVWRDVAGDYPATFQTAAGCDSVHTVTLTLGDALATTSALRACDSALVFDLWRYASGTYASAPLASSQGCDSVHTVLLTIVDGPLSAGAGFDGWPRDTTLAMGADFAIVLPQAPTGERYTYTWRPPGAVDCDTCGRAAVDTSFAGRLLAVLESAGGCRAERELLIGRLVLAIEAGVYPNAFSPNGDGVNDAFAITLPPGAVLRRAQVFDRWGGLVRETVCPCTVEPGGATVLWDGRHAKREQLVQVGVYVWLAEVEFGDDRREVIAGEVTVIR